jgi:Tol biopolymer transport system component
MLFFAVGNDGADLWAKPVNGAPGQRLLEQTTNPDFRVNPVLTNVSATSDGRSLVFVAETRGSTKNDLWILPLQANGRPAPLLRQEFDQRHGTISPDGRWLAYTSNESGVDEVFVRPQAADPATALPKVGTAIPVSQGGGMAPRWRQDARELFYQSSRGSVMAAAISANRIDKPIELFQAPGMLPHWGVAPDGQRFLLAIPVAQAVPSPFTVVLNWQAPENR